MRKKTAATIVMLVGIILFLLELFVIELDGTPGLILTIVAALMAIEGFIALCVLNRHRGEKFAENVGNGLDIIGFLLDILFDI